MSESTFNRQRDALIETIEPKIQELNRILASKGYTARINESLELVNIGRTRLKTLRPYIENWLQEHNLTELIKGKK